jgi:hypothetical protein
MGNAGIEGSEVFPKAFAKPSAIATDGLAIRVPNPQIPKSKVHSLRMKTAFLWKM